MRPAATVQAKQISSANSSDHARAGRDGASTAPPTYGIDLVDRNGAGLPERLSAGVEALSGVDVSSVRVHPNSTRPAQLKALAYTQGNDIYLAAGQQRYLPHEAWHVVQQRQGRVQPTVRMKGGIPANTDRALEAEADSMGARAMRWAAQPEPAAFHPRTERYKPLHTPAVSLASQPVQGKFTIVPRDPSKSTLESGWRWLTDPSWLRQEGTPDQRMLAALQGRKDLLVKQDSNAETLLESKQLPDLISKMLRADTNYGSFDLENDSHLVQFYNRVKLEFKGGEEPKKEEQAAIQQKKKSNEAWKTYLEAIRGVDKRADDKNVFRTVVLGRGASAAYVVENGGVPRDETTLVVGEEQPWRKERGRTGVINHPHTMIDPVHKGQGKDEGLASRQEFSDRVAKVFDTVSSLVTKIKSVRKQGMGATAHYCIETEKGGPVFAQHVIAAMGIGKHAKPKGVTDSAHKVAADVPRIMDMDEFQRAVAEGKLKPEQTPKGVIVVGPNAAIDVMSTSLRKGFKPLYWVTGKDKDPIFLKGTDNEFVEKVYQETKKGSTQKIHSQGDFTIIQYDLLKAAADDTGVKVTYGQRADSKKRLDEEIVDSETASIMVYGIGPDVETLMAPFGKIDLEPVYDIGRHFNFTDTKIGALKTAITERGKSKDAVNDVVKILGELQPITRTGDKDQPSLPATLPAVLGLRAKKTDPDDPTSLEFASGMAYRIAMKEKTPYQYLSTRLKSLQSAEIAGLEKIFGDLAVPGDTRQALDQAGSILVLLKSIAMECLSLASELEKGLEKGEVPDKYQETIEKLFTNIKDAHEKIKAFSQLKGTDKLAKAASLARDIAWDLTLSVNQTQELKGVVENIRKNDIEYGHLASTHMGAAAETLPKNVALADQLTPSRATIEARHESVPSSVTKTVDFVTHDHTVIAAHIASKYPAIPALLADYVTAKIVFERRHLELDKAPLPRPKEELGPNNTFKLKQQRDFQKKWSDKLGELAELFSPPAPGSWTGYLAAAALGAIIVGGVILSKRR